MELDITKIAHSGYPLEYLSGSIAELGSNAANLTWKNAQTFSKEHILLDTPEKINAVIDYFTSAGMEKVTQEDVHTLIIQEIAYQLREFNMYETIEEYTAASERGEVSGNIFTSNDKIYIYIGY